MNRTGLLAAIAASTMLAGCAVTATSGGTAPEKASSGIMGLMTADDLNVETKAAFKGKKDVVIGGFHIAFLEEKKASNKAGGGLLGSGFGGKSSANMELSGVDAARFQAITETAYKDFVEKLKASGYNVVDRSTLANHDDFKDVSSEKSPIEEESNLLGFGVTQTVVAPKAIGKIYDGGFGFGNPMVGAIGYADKTGTPVLFVNYVVDFANKAGGHGGYWSNTSSLEVGQGISVPPGVGLSLVGGQAGTFSSANGSIKLGQPISSTDTFGEVVNTNSEGYVAAEAAINVIGTLGGVGSNQSRTFEVKANPAKYQAVSSKVLGDANSKIINQMVALR